MTAQQILKMIEEVSPDDVAGLDEIDARVWCYLGGESWGAVEPVKFISFGDYCFDSELLYPTKSVLTFSFKGKYPHETEYRDVIERTTLTKRYTRSRDALKAIRPDCHVFYLTKIGDNWTCDIPKIETTDEQGQYCFAIGFGKSEYLAELHAIIQAIDYERNNK